MRIVDSATGAKEKEEGRRLMRSLSWVGRGGQSASGCGWLFSHYRFDRLGPIESLICTDGWSAGGHHLARWYHLHLYLLQAWGQHPRFQQDKLVTLRTQAAAGI